MMRRRGERHPRLVPVLVILAGALIGAAILAAAPERPVNRVVLCENRAGCDGSDIRFQNQDAVTIPADVDFGFSTAMGYLNDDKLADMVVGAPGENRVYVFFGGVDNKSRGEIDPNRPLDASLADVIITGVAGTQFGFSVAIPPPTGGDYSQPVIIGAPGMTTGAPGAAYIVPSKNPVPSDWAPLGARGLSSFMQRISFAGVNNGDEAGYMVAAGEIFTPGLTDFVVAARRGDRTPADPNDDSGIVYVIDETAVVSGSAIGLSTVRRMIGAVPRGGLGESLAIGNFLTAVGGNEIAVTGVGTIPNDTSNAAGRLYVVSVPLPSVMTGIPIDLGVTGSTPMSRVRGDTKNDFFGFSLTALDLDPNTTANGNELAVGAIYADRVGPPFQTNAGAVYLFDPNALAALSSPPIDPSTDPNAGTTARRIIRGQRLWDEFGFGLASGDVTGDGVDDLVAAARKHDRDPNVVNEVDEGTVYLFSGTSVLSATTPLLLDCVEAACTSNIAGVDAMIFGGDYRNSRSEEIGFSLAVGDFNQDSVYDDIAIASITHERVYLVSLNSGDKTPATAPGQKDDAARDIRDRDDDGDGYTDVEEDNYVLDGIYNPGGNESDTLVPNRDVTVSVTSQDPNNILKCDDTLEVRVTVSNSGRRISFFDPEVMIALPASPFIYDPNSTVIWRKGVSTPVPDGGGSAFPFLAFRSITASGAARPSTDPLLGTDPNIPSTLADQTIEVRFRLKAAIPLAYNAPTTGMVNATVRLKPTENEEVPYPGLGLTNTANLTVNLIRPFLRATKSASYVNGDPLNPLLQLDPLDKILYTVTVTNPAPSATYRAANVVLTDVMPANCTFDPNSAMTTQGMVTGGATVTANLGTIDVNGTATVTFKCLVSETVANNTIISNQATITEPCQGTVLSDSTDALDNDGLNTGNNPADVIDDDTTKDTVIVNPVILVAKSTTMSTATVGDVVMYTYTVSNGGNVKLSAIAVTDNNCSPLSLPSGDTNINTKLDLGETWTYTCSRTVLVGDLRGPLTNTVTARGEAPAGPPPTGPPLAMDTDTVSVNIAEIRVVKGTNPVVTTAKVGDMINYTYAVTSIGNVPLSTVTVTDNKCATVAYTNGDTNTDSILDLTETWNYTCARTVLVGDLPGPLVNMATAGGFFGVKQALDTNSVSVTLAGIQVIKSTLPVTTTAKVGDVIPYRYTVTTTGAALSTVTVTDNKCGPAMFVSGDTNPNNTLLDPNETWTYTCNYTVLPADLLTAPLVNTATAMGKVNLVTVTDTDSISVDLAGINVDKTTTVSSATVGDLIPYAYSVTNTGNVALSTVTVTDDKCSPAPLPLLGGDININTLLDLTEIWTYTCTYTVLKADLPTLMNTATAMGTSGGVTASDTDMVSIELAAIQVVKSTFPVTPVSTVGLVIPYRYSVTNLGNLPLGTVTVTDDKCGSATFDSGDTNPNNMLLDLTETWTYTCAYTVQPTDLPGPLINTATAMGTSGGVTATDIDSWSVDLAAIQVVKTIFPVVTLAAPGDPITYGYSVTNLGNLPLGTVTVMDDKCGPATFDSGDTNPNNMLLDLTETWTYTCTYMVVQDDLPSPLVNIATATGTASGFIASDTDSKSVDLVGIEVVKSTNPVITDAAVGDIIPYTYSVTNPGSVPLSTVTVMDPNCTPVYDSGDTNTDTILDPNTETWLYKCDYTVVADDLDNSPLVNTATASGIYSAIPVTVTDTDTYSINIANLRVVKSTNPATTTAKVGDVIHYEYALDLQGKGKITDITVTDPNCTPVYASGDNSPTGTLNINEIWLYTCDYTVLASDLPGPIANTVTATGKSGSSTVTDTSNWSVDLVGIMVMNSASTASAMSGDPITYTYTTTNTGGVALASVTASDDLCSPPDLTLQSGDTNTDNILDLTEVWTYTCAYTVLPTDPNGPLDNTVMVSGASGGVTATDTALASVTISLVAPPPSTLQLQLDGARRLTWGGVSGVTNYHIYRGDLSVLRTTGTYVQNASASPNAARFCWMSATAYDDGFMPSAGGAVFYLVAADNGVSEGSLGNDSQGQAITNDNPCR